MNELFDLKEMAALEKAEASQATTTKELAESLGVSARTIQNTANRLFDPAKVHSRVINGGKSMVFNKTQATAIMREIKKHHNSGDLIKTADNDVSIMLDAKNVIERLVGRIDILQKECAAKDAVINEQNEKIAIDEPKVDFYNRFAGSYGDMCIRDGAKTLGYKRQQDFFELLGEKYTFETPHNRYMPYQKYIEQGLFKIKVGVSKSIPPFQTSTTHLTSKGLQYFASKLGEKND